jgi:hypothetical protein
MERAIEPLRVEETARHPDRHRQDPLPPPRPRADAADAANDIEAAGLAAFYFRGPRCDRIIAAVLKRLAAR